MDRALILRHNRGMDYSFVLPMASSSPLVPSLMEQEHLYEQADFRAVTGDVLRPGGRDLTLRGLELCGLKPVGRTSRAHTTDDERSRRELAVLDVGCGAGATAALLRALGFRVTGVDPSQAMLDEAARNAELVPSGESLFLPGRADNLPVDKATQDAVVCECVLSLTPDPGAALAEMARVLRPGGMLLFSDVYVRFPGATEGPRSRSGGSCLEGAVPVEAWRNLLASHNFHVLVEEDHSRALAELAARLVLGGGSVTQLATWLGASCAASRESSRDLLRRLGYLLLIARKE